MGGGVGRSGGGWELGRTAAAGGWGQGEGREGPCPAAARAHQSTARSWPWRRICSGARYAGVPHSVYVFPALTRFTKLR